MPALPSLLLVLPPQLGLLEGFGGAMTDLANYVQPRLPLASVRIADLSLTPRTSVDRAVEDLAQTPGEPLFVGISVTTATYQAGLRVASSFRRHRPDCVIVLGGHHVSPEADVVLQWHSEIDFVIRGEGEIALFELLRNYPAVADVPNLAYRDGSRTIRTDAAPLLTTQDLDKLSPHFRDVEMKCAPGKFEHVTYVSARGCPLKCSFCAVANEAIRHKSIDAIVNDLEYLVTVRGSRRIAIEDNFFAHAPRRTLELCGALRGLRERHSFSWDCQTRVESLRRDDVVAAMAAAGCEAVYVGVEAFDAEQLLYLGKTTHPGSYVKAVEQDVVPRLLAHGIACYVNVQVGLPNRSSKTREATLRALTTIGRIARTAHTDITVFPQLHVVYPGTMHWRNLQTDRVSGPLPSDTFEYFTAWEDENEPVLRWLGKRFAHGTGGIPIGILDSGILRSRTGRDRFQVNPEAILTLEDELDEIAAIPGITIFSYSKFLAQPIEAPTRSADTRAVHPR